MDSFSHLRQFRCGTHPWSMGEVMQVLDYLAPESKVGIHFAVEPWSVVRPQMEPLLPQHWEEVAMDKDRIKLAVDDEAYDNIDRLGLLHVVTVRDGEKLVGYYVGIIKPHLHYKNDLMAFTDVYFLQKSYRKGRTGINFFKFVEKSLVQKGVVKITMGTKLHVDNSRLLEHLGYKPVEMMFSKYVGKK